MISGAYWGTHGCKGLGREKGDRMIAVSSLGEQMDTNTLYRGRGGLKRIMTDSVLAVVSLNFPRDILGEMDA